MCKITRNQLQPLQGYRQHTANVRNQRPLPRQASGLVSFCMRHSEVKRIVTRAICMPVPHRILTLRHGPRCNFGKLQQVPLVVHYWAALQLVSRFHCYGNIVDANAKCQRGHLFAAWLILFIHSFIYYKNI